MLTGTISVINEKEKLKSTSRVVKTDYPARLRSALADSRLYQTGPKNSVEIRA